MWAPCARAADCTGPSAFPQPRRPPRPRCPVHALSPYRQATGFERHNVCGMVYYTLKAAPPAGASGPASVNDARGGAYGDGTPVIMMHGVAAGVLPYLDLLFTLAATGGCKKKNCRAPRGRLLPGAPPSSRLARAGACARPRRLGSERGGGSACGGARGPFRAGPGCGPGPPLHPAQTNSPRARSLTRRPPAGDPRVPPRQHAADHQHPQHRAAGRLGRLFPAAHGIRKGGGAFGGHERMWNTNGRALYCTL